MIQAWNHILLVLHLLVLTSWGLLSDFKSPFNWCESTHKPHPFYGPTPSIPQLPRQYSLKVEANILEKDWTTEMEEHYDKPNQRASLALTFNGTTTRTIFNFDADEKYDIYPNGTCGTRPGHIDFFGYYTKDKNGRASMATVNEMLRMGYRFNLTYIGQTAVRGIKVNHWTSCQEWKAVGARFQLDYYFTHPDYQPATGQVSSQMPLRIVLNGTAGNINMMDKPMKGSHNFYHFYDFTSIRVGPPRDLTVFEIPPGVVCKGRSDHKTMPALPDVFQMSMEVTMPDCPMPPQHQTMVYDYEHKLVETRREMMVPQGWGSKPLQELVAAKQELDTDSLVEKKINVIEDYSTSLRYIVNPTNFQCKVERMAPSGETPPVMAHGETLLKIAHGQKSRSMDFTYQGVTTIRGMKVEVWGSEEDGITQQVFFLAHPSLHPTSMKTAGDADDTNDEDDDNSKWAQGPWPGKGQQSSGTGSGPWNQNSGGTGPWNQNGDADQNTQPQKPAAGSDGQDDTTRKPNGDGSNQGNRPKGQNGQGNRPKGQNGQGNRPNGQNGQGNRPNGQNGQGNRPNGQNTQGNRPNGQNAQGNRPNGQNAQGNRPKGQNGQGDNQGEQPQKPSSGFLPGTGKPSEEMMKKMKDGMHKPHVLGFFFKNKTAVAQRNLVVFFQQIMTERTMKWMSMAQEMAERQNGDNNNDDGGMSAGRGDQITWGLHMERSMKNHHGEAMINVYNFKPTHSHADHFQVAFCYEAEQTSQVMLMVKTAFKENVLSRKTEFVNALRRAVAESLDVSILAISNMMAMPYRVKAGDRDVDATTVTFTLLGQTPLGGSAIEVSKAKLIRAIANGIGFKVNHMTHTKSFMVDRSEFRLDYTKAGFDDKNLPQGGDGDKRPGNQAVSDGRKGGQSSDDGDTVSSGGVVGIAIATMALGAILAIVVAAVLYKRRKHELPMVPFNSEV